MVKVNVYTLSNDGESNKLEELPMESIFKQIDKLRLQDEEMNSVKEAAKQAGLKSNYADQLESVATRIKSSYDDKEIRIANFSILSSELERAYKYNSDSLKMFIYTAIRYGSVCDELEAEDSDDYDFDTFEDKFVTVDDKALAELANFWAKLNGFEFQKVAK